MTDTFKKLYQGSIVATAATPVYNVPAATSTIIKQIRVANTDGSTANSITVYNGSAGSALTTSHIILPTITIDAGGFAEFEGTITLGAGESFGVKAGVASKLTLTLYGLEIT